MAVLRRPRGRSSSLRCGRSTSTPTVGPPSSSTGENEAKTNANQRTLTFTGVPNTDKETLLMTLSTAQLDRACGVLLGTAAGDALGAAYEFGPPRGPELEVAMVGGGAFGWEPGEWTDDTSM